MEIDEVKKIMGKDFCSSGLDFCVMTVDMTKEIMDWRSKEIEKFYNSDVTKWDCNEMRSGTASQISFGVYDNETDSLIAQLRSDLSENSSTLAIKVNPKFPKQMYGYRVIDAYVRQLQNEGLSGFHVWASAKVENKFSQALFRGLGFKVIKDNFGGPRRPELWVDFYVKAGDYATPPKLKDFMRDKTKEPEFQLESEMVGA